MALDLKALQDDVLRISDIYAREHSIERDRDWALLKLQEELGELTAEHLRHHHGQQRIGGDVERHAEEHIRRPPVSYTHLDAADE